VYFFAHDADDTLFLEVTTIPLIAQADGNQLVSTWTLPVDDVTIRVDEGEDVSSAACTDVIANGGPQVAHSWTARTGTVKVTITPPPYEDEAPKASLELTDVHLEGELQPLDIGTFEIADKVIGQFSG
jgi:hypothetical protein